MSNVKITADLGPALTVTHTMGSLDGALNEKGHLQTMTKSAFAIMEGEFVWDTAAIAGLQPESFHHIYEPEHIGEPPFQLFSVKMRGSGGNRTISWDWRASKLTVPTDVGPTGKDRWAGSSSSFDPSKLNRVHVFVWKAPIMEYGTTVTVRPLLSSRRLLVFPGQDVEGTGRRGAVFTPHSYTFTPGREVHGNFTSWFIKWWGDGMAEASLKNFTRRRDIAFRRSFESRIAAASKAKGKLGASPFTVNAEAARKGEAVAGLIRGDLDRKYIEMARQRRKVTSPDEE